MKQTRLGSMHEATVNVSLGFVLSLALQIILMDAYQLHSTFDKDFAITCWFTVLSLLRSYFVRRLFVGVGQ